MWNNLLVGHNELLCDGKVNGVEIKVTRAPDGRANSCNQAETRKSIKMERLRKEKGQNQDRPSRLG